MTLRPLISDPYHVELEHLAGHADELGDVGLRAPPVPVHQFLDVCSAVGLYDENDLEAMYGLDLYLADGPMPFKIRPSMSYPVRSELTYGFFVQYTNYLI